MAASDPQTLLSEVPCHSCFTGLDVEQMLEIALLQRIALFGGAGGNPPGPPPAGCSPPSRPIVILFQTATPGIQLNIIYAVPTPTNGQIVYWGTTPGGPYPNSKHVPLAPNPELTQADGLVGGTTYYFVVQGDNGGGCLGPLSIEHSIQMPGTSLTNDWLNRIAAAGGAQPSQATISAVDTFLNTLVNNSLDSLFIALAVFVQDNVIAAITPVVRNGGPASWTNHGFVIGDLTVQGLKGDGAAKFLDTGCSPIVVYPADSNGGIGIYTSLIPAAESKNDSGSQDATLNSEIAMYANFNGRVEFDCWTFGSVANGAAPSNTTAGFCDGSLVSGTNTVYFANATHAHSALATGLAAGGRTNSNVYFFAVNANGVTSGFCTKRFFAAWLIKSHTAGQSSTIFSAMQTLFTNLGGVPP